MKIFHYIGEIVRLAFRFLVEFPLARFAPKNTKKIVFGAYGGIKFECNPKYLFLWFLKAHPEYKCIWIGSREQKHKVLSHPGAHFAEYKSMIARYHILTAKTAVCNVDYAGEFFSVPNCGRTIILNTYHGIPTKRVYEAQLDGKGCVLESCAEVKVGFVRRFLDWLEKDLISEKAWHSASSEWSSQIVSGFTHRIFSSERIVACGYPRNDFLISNAKNNAVMLDVKHRLALALNIDEKKNWYLYVPTWRHSNEVPFSFAHSARTCEYQDLLRKQNAIMIEKQHLLMMERLNLSGGVNGNICVMSRHQSNIVDVQELLLCCDVLVSDYSSVVYDYSLLDRPVIQFMYDYDAIANREFGLEYDMREYSPGVIVMSEEECLNALRMPRNELMKKRGSKYRRLVDSETGHACESYYKLMIDALKLSRQQ